MSTTQNRSLESSSAQEQMQRLATKLIDSTVQQFTDDQKDFEEVDPDRTASLADKRELHDQTVTIKLKAVVDDDDKEEPDKAQSLEPSEMAQLNALAEDELVHSERFATELDSALEHITDIAKAHRIEMVDAAKASFQRETGLEATPQMLEEALKPFAAQSEQSNIAEPTEQEIETINDDDEDNDEEIDEALLAREMAEALETVRALGRSHQTALVDSVCDLYAENNDGTEMSLDALSLLFGGIRSDLAEEAELAAETDESIDGELAEGELESALALCSDLGRAHQPALIESIRATVREVRGAEPNDGEISSILARIKAEFAAEARDEFLEHFDRDEDATDSDYHAEDDNDTFLSHRDRADDVDGGGDSNDAADAEYSPELDAFDYRADLLDDLDFDKADSESNDGASQQSGVDTAPLWISATTSSRAGAKAYSVYFAEMSSEVHVSNFVCAMDSFRLRNDRSPTSVEQNQLQQFLSAQDAVVEKLDGNGFDAQLDSALDHVRELALVHRAEFVEAICELFDAEHGREPDADELRMLFRGIQNELAEEAREEQSDDKTSDDAQSDSDYEDDADSFDYGADEVDDVASSQGRSESFTAADTSLLISATTTSRTGAAEAFSVYFNESSMRSDLSKAIDSFRMRNKRSPTATERARLQQFLSTQSVVDEVSVSAQFEDSERGEAEFALSQMDSALCHIRELGASHQSALVDAMSAIYCWNHGDAPSLSELYALFGAMKGLFAEEARNDTVFEAQSVEESESESEAESDDDADYDPEQDTFDYAVDNDNSVGSEVKIYAEPAAVDAVLSLSVLNRDAGQVLSVHDLNSALEHARELSSAHRLKELPSVSQLERIISDIDQSAVASEDVRSALDSALDHIRGLATQHQSDFVGRISDLFAEEYDAEPSAWELSELFRGIQLQFAKEADLTGSAFIVSVGESASESESEKESEQDLSERDSYAPEQDSFDYAVDSEDDIDSELQIEAESEIESESVDASEAEREDYSEGDNYYPSDDSFDYAVDADDSAAFASDSDAKFGNSVSVSATESEAESVADSMSESVSEDETTDKVREIFDMAQQMFADEASEADSDSVATVELFDDAFVVRGVSIETSNSISESAITESSASATALTDSDAELGEEMDSALDHIRGLAKLRQEGFVNSICDLYRDSNDGVEPSKDQLFGIFDFIKHELVVEAREESDGEDDGDESEASEYDPDTDTFDYCLDIEDDVESESVAESVDADTSLLISATTTSRTAASETFSVYFNDNSMRSDLSKAIDSFRMRNKRSPTSAERKHMQQFLSTQSVVDEVTVSAQSEDPELALVNSARFAAEWQSAIEHIEHLASARQEGFVNSICDIYRESNDGAEPSTTELFDIFGDVKNEFAEEAWNEHDDDETEDESESDEIEEESEASDIDYSPDDDAFDYCLDIEDDFGFITDAESVIESEAESVDADTSLLISATTTSRTGAAEAFSVYFHENSMRSDLSKAIDSFRMRNKRSPTSAERERLQQFLSTQSVVDEVTISGETEEVNESDRAEFEREMALALRGVRDLGRRHRLHFACTLIDVFAEHNEGRHPDAEEMVQIFSGIVDDFADEAAEQTDDAEGEDFSEQFDSAIEHVRDLGAQRQPALVDRICGIFASSSGMEATVTHLSEMFASIKASFVSEEKQDFLKNDSGASADEQLDLARDADESVSDSLTQSESISAESDLNNSESESEEENDAESESSSIEESIESEESSSERDSGDGKDSEYNPDRDTFDYCRDIEEDHLGSSDSDSEEEESESDSAHLSLH